MANGTCSIPDCGRKALMRTWCATHYNRWRETGVVGGPIEPRRKNVGTLCSAPDCARPAVSVGMCSTHYQRSIGRNKLPLDAPVVRYGFKGDDITYSGMHMRLKRWRGDAAVFRCIDCDEPAMHWSYDNADPDERIDALSGLAYSTDTEHYEPRCVSCHARFDLQCGSRQLPA